MVTIKRGDLLEATETVIAHQVNCFGMAGGLAAAVFKKYPDAGSDYQQIVNRFPYKNMLLGLAVMTGQHKDGHIICNLFGQMNPGADYNPAALRKALTLLADMAKSGGYSVALPYKLSCGIAGGNWDEVQAIIGHTMEGVECVIYKRDEDE